MKKSEILEREAQREDNDSRAFALHAKAGREARAENFEERWAQKFADHHGSNFTFCESKGCYSLFLPNFGTVDFYPKAGKLLIRRENRWVPNGKKWLLNNGLPKEQTEPLPEKQRQKWIDI